MRWKRTLLSAGVALSLLSGVVGCRPQNRGMLVSIRPPDSWEEQLGASRKAKDAYFKSSPESPLLEEDRASFEALDYWTPDPGYYFVGQINLHFEPQMLNIVTTNGKQRPVERFGWIGFELGGQPLRLQVYRLLDMDPAMGDGLFLPFMDVTSGAQTYPAGRYIDLQGPRGGPYVVDFNQAYNPSCAYGAPERFACPVTPPENRLAVPIEAGERGYTLRVEG